MAKGHWTSQHPTTDGRLPEGCRPGCKSISVAVIGRIVLNDGYSGYGEVAMRVEQGQARE